MKDRIFGNGSGKGVAHRSQVRPGYVIYHAGDPAPAPEDLPVLFNKMVLDDLGELPQIRVQAVLPIVREGNTIAIHLWYQDLAAGQVTEGDTDAL